MTCKNNFEQQIKNCLHEQADGLELSPAAAERILSEIKSSKAKEHQTMKKFNKKLIAAVAVIVCLGCGGAIAAGSGLHGWVSSSLVNTRTDSYQVMLENNQEKLDFTPVTVEGFANGFAFDYADIGVSQGLDADNNRMTHKYHEADLVYANADTGEQLYLNINNIPDMTPSPELCPKAQTTVYNDITLYYEEQQYKFVPLNYEFTAEDEAAMASGEIEFSYGSDQVEEQLISTVQWTMDGINYDLLGYDLTLSADDMYAMAAEIIASK